MRISQGTSRTWRSRALRAVVAAIVGLVPVAVVAPAAHANALGALQSSATWSSVVASVGAGTPLWTLDVTFQLSGVSCTNGAELHYKIDTSAQKAVLCGAGGSAPTSYTVRRPVFSTSGSNLSTLTPSSTAEVRAEVRDPANGLNNNPGGPVRPINVPPAPKWIGMGDGYTSAVYQPYDASVTDYVSSKPTHSWIQAATTKLNGAYGVPNTWAVSPLVIADTSATAIANGGSSVDLQDQIAQMESALASAAGSWNWIGMSAGLVDVGIPTALASYYATYDADAGSTVKPWDATATAECPDLSTVSSNITSLGSSIKGALDNVVAKAKLKDPSVRVINVLYPYLTDGTNEQVTGDSGPYVNPCAAANRPVINSLDGAITLSGTNVYNLDLRSSAGFGDRPTGTRVYTEGDDPNTRVVETGGVSRTGSFLWLTREHGYPYPSPSGSSQAGNSAVEITTKTVTDVEPPIVTGVPLRPPDKNGWYNRAVGIRWTAKDRPDPGGTGIKGSSQLDTPADVEGLQRRWTSPDFCDNNSPALCATGNVDLSTDFTPPTIAVKTDSQPNAKGWWNRPVTVSWSFTTDNVSGADTATKAPNHLQSLNVLGVTVQNGLGTMCDKAGNCADGTKAPAASVVLNLDQVNPIVTGALSSSTMPRNGWYRGDVTVTWTVTDQGGSGVDTTRVPDVSKVTTDGKDKTVTSGSAYDNADNTSKGVVTVSIDRTPPSISIKGPIDGATYSTANRPPGVTCEAADALSGVDGGCTVATTRVVVRDSSGAATGSRYTVTANAKDLAGNGAPEKTISYVVEGDVDLQPPVVTARVEHDPPTGSRWYKAPVKIYWDVTDPDTHPNPVANPAYTLATVEGDAIRYDSPEVCDGASTPELPKGNCAPLGSAHAKISLDTIRPNVSVSGPLQGATYTKSNVPEVTALCSDDTPGSGLVAGSCVLEETGRVNLQKDDPFSPPGHVLTYVAKAADHAGWTNESEARTFTLYDFEQVDRGRMVGGVDVGSTKTSFTLRCNGSPNELGATWTGGSFTLTHVSRVWCWDDSGWNEGSPDAPMDALVVWGEGLLGDGTPAHVRFAVSDRGEPGKGADAMQLIVAKQSLIGRARDLSSAEIIHTTSGFHTGGGNVQAEDAAGGGTNDSGDLNKPGK